MSERLTVDGHLFWCWGDPARGIDVMHPDPAMPASSHSIGHRLPDMAAVESAARRHLALLADTGNCRGQIPVRMNFLGKTHVGTVGGRRTKCGRDLPDRAERFRVRPPAPIDRCGACDRAY